MSQFFADFHLITLNHIGSFLLLCHCYNPCFCSAQLEFKINNIAITLIYFRIIVVFKLQYFSNEKYEADRYDKVLAKYEKASLKTTTSLAMLNFGQNAIFSAGLTVFMYLASQGIVQGRFDLSLIILCDSLVQFCRNN